MLNKSLCLTILNLLRALLKKRVDAKKTNKDYTKSFFYNVFRSSKCVLSSLFLLATS
jgi:hypothetical protein